ncbi:energy transducer TonB [Flavihumibacter petaseus]|uniref:TonB C-terminal domain-containing protein n=1 Tax=Flavihumibacter petaseus NBRC 106054 TaxID=1220578 RepID=A0A0E9MY36_9BACT|nr:energy transducer TonB [Flavihumibacter petaseus]GAO42642.1 hypothetical protein FPE01S_01_16570 [Flavihumibacter petaseus NBRC 106054]
MRHLILALLSPLFLATSGNAQKLKDENFYVFDANWKGAEIEQAVYMLRTYKVNDTCYQWEFYNFKGPILRSEQSRDKDGDIMHGVCYHYDGNGILDSISRFYQGKKHGESARLKTDSFRYDIVYTYENDQLVKTEKAGEHQKREDLQFDLGIESEYPGGVGAWSNYLTKTLVYPQRAVQLEKQGTVRVAFIVDKEGNVTEPFIWKSVEYTIDAESVRIIRKSGKWKPAIQNGRTVKSYKVQPITFRLQ